eukprot:c8703_g1_i1.p1 GENE.c8703_g1_i1~~c8703_g1_i1.p1  ORF type:complete len:270 (+),score=107.55 c8703_g1_i1:40-849(+)
MKLITIFILLFIITFVVGRKVLVDSDDDNNKSSTKSLTKQSRNNLEEEEEEELFGDPCDCATDCEKMEEDPQLCQAKKKKSCTCNHCRYYDKNNKLSPSLSLPKIKSGCVSICDCQDHCSGKYCLDPPTQKIGSICAYISYEITFMKSKSFCEISHEKGKCISSNYFQTLPPDPRLSWEAKQQQNRLLDEKMNECYPPCDCANTCLWLQGSQEVNFKVKKISQFSPISNPKCWGKITQTVINSSRNNNLELKSFYYDTMSYSEFCLTCF